LPAPLSVRRARAHFPLSAVNDKMGLVQILEGHSEVAANPTLRAPRDYFRFAR
jgi:hypothetical protein